MPFNPVTGVFDPDVLTGQPFNASPASNLNFLSGATPVGNPLQTSLVPGFNGNVNANPLDFGGLTPNALSPTALSNPNTGQLFPGVDLNAGGAAGGGDGFFGSLGQQIQANPLQALGTGIQGLGAIGGAFLGFQQLGLAQEQFDFQRDAFTQQAADARRDLEADRADRARRRRSASPTDVSGGAV